MKLSIITINKNNAAGLEKTIQSVVRQTYTDFEYIVIDGASDDGSVEVIKKFTEKITYWVSEPDTGIYNAMNKGIRKSQGDYCLFLNSGDWLIESETLQNVFKETAEAGEADIYYSDQEKTDSATTCYSKSLTMLDLILNSINHQNSLIRRSLFTEHGYYNENLQIVSDWEFFLNEMYIYHTIFFHIHTHIALYDIHGISSQDTLDRDNENRIIFINVFDYRLGEPLFELRKAKKSLERLDPIYIRIIKEYGNSKLLHRALKCFFIIKKIIHLIATHFSKKVNHAF